MIDVFVIGGGNVVLCVVLMVCEVGVLVLLLEVVLCEWCGGNFQYICNLCCMYDGLQDVLVGVYLEEEYW